MPTCPECKREFTTNNGLKNHRAAKHTEEREPSIAQRAIDAQLNHAMGLPSDDEFDWLEH